MEVDSGAVDSALCISQIRDQETWLEAKVIATEASLCGWCYSEVEKESYFKGFADKVRIGLKCDLNNLTNKICPKNVTHKMRPIK